MIQGHLNVTLVHAPSSIFMKKNAFEILFHAAKVSVSFWKHFVVPP